MNRLLMIFRTRTGRTAVVAALWLAGAALVAAGAAVPNRLQTVQTTAMSADSAEIILTLDQTAPAPRVFAVAHPARLAIDLPGTALGVDNRYRNVKAGPVTGLTLAAADGRSRVVVDLAQPVTYDVSRHGNTIRIVVNSTPGAPVIPSPTTGASGVNVAANHTAAAPIADAPATANRVTDIDFRRGPNDAGRLQITLSGVGGPPDVKEQDGKVVAILPNTAVPPRLEKQLDVRDFATPFDYVDIFSHGDDTRIVVTPASNAHFQRSARQLAHKFVLELTPVARTVARHESEREDNKPRFTGEKITLNLQDAPIRGVLDIIADTADVNMIVADNVSGNVTLRLENVPWDQALHLVLSINNLGMRRVGNVMRIAPLSQIVELEKAQLNAYQATHNSVPLVTRILQINYARAADIATIIQSGEGKTAMLSERGRVTVDNRTNSLLITDTPKRIASVKQIIEQLDNPVRQVLVEARIVEASRDFSRELGIMQRATTGNNDGDLDNTGNDTDVLRPTLGEFTGESGFTINLPGSGAELVTSIISNSFSLDLALHAMETENRGEIISAPRIITTDGQQAVIEQGREIPYTTVSSNGTQTEFKKAVLSLEVTPHVTPNEHVLLNLTLTQDTPVEGAGDEPPIATRRLQTQVLVDSGDTVVLGGIFTQQETHGESQIPFLGDAPIIGPLFSSTSRVFRKRELMLFITPTILEKMLTSN